MANLTARVVTSGEDFDLADMDLDQVTNRDVIDQLIEGGALKPESELPAAGGTPQKYSIVSKDGVKVDTDDVRPLSKFGFTDGDTVRIITMGAAAIV